MKPRLGKKGRKALVAKKAAPKKKAVKRVLISDVCKEGKTYQVPEPEPMPCPEPESVGGSDGPGEEFNQA